tara:strand:+ start:113 stop:1216 length:1104 start_codon:yes stop_codon:yes gene_type:complete
MADFNVNRIISTQDQNGVSILQGPVIAGITTVNSTGVMRIPSGPTSYRGGRGRGIAGSGYTPNSETTIDYYEIASLGNATDYGDIISTGAAMAGSASNDTRGVIAGGFEGAPANGRINTVQALTIPTTGEIFDFGDLTYTTQQATGTSNSTRAVYTSGNSMPLSPVGVLNFNYLIQFSTSGSVQDFGDIRSDASCRQPSTCETPIRGYCAGGEGTGINSEVYNKNITITTFATLGSSDKFGELSTFRYAGSGVGSVTRGVFIGGTTPTPSADTYQNSIDYITLSTTGEATDFGDVASGNSSASNNNSASNTVRGVFHHARTADGGTPLNTLEYITIATTGNSTDFGDLNFAAQNGFGVSDSHGGLSY